MKIRRRHIPIFLSVTNESLPYLTVTLESICEHTANECTVDARILCCDLASYNRRKLRHMKFENIDITIVDVDSRVEDYRADFEERLGCFYGEEVFYLFFIADMYPRLAKAMYVSCGTIFRDDVEKLYHVDLGDDLIGGIVKQDKFSDRLRAYRERWVGVNPDEYVDCSAILINLSLFRKYRISGRFARLLMGYNFDTVSAASDYMNFLCRGRVRVLNSEWKIDDDSAAGIAVFSPYQLPWHYVNMPYADEFWDVARKTPLYEDVRDAYICFDEAARVKEIKNVNDVLSHASELEGSRGGFYDILGDDYLI